MARRKVPSSAASGADTFSDNIVGNQITNGSSQLTNSNFDLDTSTPEKESKQFRTNPFSEYFNLEKLKVDPTNTPVTTEENISQKKKSVRFRTSKNDAGKSLYGSLKSRIRVSIEQIIKKFPAALYVDKDSPVTISGLTAFQASYNIPTKTTQFKIEVGMLYNVFDIKLTKPVAANAKGSENPLRDLYSSYKKYVIEISGKTYNVVNYTQPDSQNTITLKVNGNPFNNASSFSDSFIIRPNNAVKEEFFLSLDDIQECILNRDGFPKYTSKFKVPRDSFDQSKTSIVTVEYSWPMSKDGWNIQIVGLDFDQYLSNLSDIADEIDDYKSNIVTRFLVAPQLFEFDTPDQKAESIFQLYGQSFDNIKKFIDNIAYMRNVSYDGINNLPDVLLKNLSTTLGLDTINLFDETDLDELLYTQTSTQYSGLTFGTSIIDAEYEFYRRMLINLAYIYKSKGTQKSLNFFLKFIGAADPMMKLEQYAYKIKSFPKSNNL